MNVVVKGIGLNDNIEAQVDPSFGAMRMNIRPTEYNVGGLKGGHYKMIALYSSTAAKPAAASDVFSMRWTDTRFRFVLKRLTVIGAATTAYTANGVQDFSLYMARGFSVSPSAGTQIIPLAGGQAMNSTDMKKSGLDGTSGVLWVSSGDLLTTGTRTLDTQPIGYVSWLNPITNVGSPFNFDLFEMRDFGEHPVVLSQNEGLVVQTPIGNAQAAGVSKYGFLMEWAEIPAASTY